MEPSRTVRFKVCCIQDVAEADLAVAAGAHALGLVSGMPSGPGPIDMETIARICRHTPPTVATFLLSAAVDPVELARQQRQSGASVIQLVSPVEPGVVRELARELPGIGIVPVVHVTGPASIDEALLLADAGAKLVLLDSGNPAATVPELGGTGRVHDWSISRRIRERLWIPVLLAGGLNPGNVAAAVARVGPFGVDVCSGLRRGGRLQPDLLEDFRDALQPVD